MTDIESDMWDHGTKCKEKCRAAVEHRIIRQESSGLIRRVCASDKHPLQPRIAALTFQRTQMERRDTLMAQISGMEAESGTMKAQSQAQEEKTRVATLHLPLLRITVGSSPSKKTKLEWKLVPETNNEETSSQLNIEAEDEEAEWKQVHASKGFWNALYFVMRDHRKTKATATENTHEEYDLMFTRTPTTGRMNRGLKLKAQVEHVENISIAEDDSEGFHVTATFAKRTKSSKIVRLKDGLVRGNTSLLRHVFTLKSKTKSDTESSIENNDPKTPKLQLIVVSTTRQEPTAYSVQTFDETFVPISSLASATAYTAQAFSNTTSTIAFSSKGLKDERKASQAENQLIEIERSPYGWYVPSYLLEDRVQA